MESATDKLSQRLSETHERLFSNFSILDLRSSEANNQTYKLTSTLHKLINETNEQLYGLSSTFNQRLTESNGRFETISSTLNQKFYDTQSQLEATTSSLYQRLDEEHAQLEGKSSELNHRLNEAHTTLDGLSSSANYLMGRVEFVRRELMFEMRYGGKAPNSQVEKIKTKVEIINKNKYAAARNNQLRLNLGCGHIALEDYLNVDRRALPGVDIVAEADELPFEPGEVDEIFSSHLLEHFPQEQLRRELLPYYFSLLKNGGVFRAVVPDAEAMIQEYTKSNYPYDDMREVIYGAQDYDGDFHFNMFTADSLKKLIEEAGFISVNIDATGRVNGKCFEMEISARKNIL
jgi:predicted SAM-dependent methyltransferase